ncbi:Cullin-domain-containing protein [Neocallimastix lanati (nom. inval.)]|uniref:Cullin-domain-containing protein n=1 Tax=Neocallimastix californiae TaxID=1754190 RepID=A0A1Y2ES61_9FUNG|nr:Cullin-domain-containing protein [Neocallimastix sp. JGI-2020a]ORY74423.1 Cullin-domain-containing protein [Neocallimastix californiae]|eukprot:ORY74423.1 Cullin-domain-containing protein [Neocallimastix californiae]
MTIIPVPIQFDNIYQNFEKNLKEIYKNSNNKYSYNELYNMVYTIIIAKKDINNEEPEKPFKIQFGEKITKFLDNSTHEICNDIIKEDDVIKAYANQWNVYYISSQISDKICVYYNRSLSYQNFSNIKNKMDKTYFVLSLEKWKDNVIFNLKNNFDNILIKQILESIDNERNNGTTTNKFIKEAVDSFVKVKHDNYNNKIVYGHSQKLYEDEFEAPYLENIRNYYKKESAELIEKISIEEYVSKVLTRIDEEVQRCRYLCVSSSLQKVLEVCKEQLIIQYKQKLLDKFEDLLKNKQYKDCTNMYKLLSIVNDGINSLASIYEDYIAKYGFNQCKKLGNIKLKDSKAYVDTLIEVHKKFRDITKDVFNSNPEFFAAVDKSLSKVINTPTSGKISHSPEILAKYCDFLLKKSPKVTLNEDEIKQKLENVIILFKYIDDKDIFQKFYSKILAKRLIYGTSVSEELEENMINRLKLSCGVEYTNKLQRMFTDINVCKDINYNFKEYLKSKNIKQTVDSNILVLTSGSWPLTNSNITFQIPVELEDNINNFTEFYQKEHNGRKLTWLYQLSKADVRLHMEDKRYELNMTLYQLAILLLFNNEDSFTINDIVNQTQLPLSEVSRFLKAFIDLKLLNAPNTESLDTVVTFNKNFSNKRTKIKIGMTADNSQENEITRQAVDNDRKLFLQAVIVRIMKSKKELQHTLLIKEVIEQSKSRFVPYIPTIKQAIEQLIDKQYIERVNNDYYTYIA